MKSYSREYLQDRRNQRYYRLAAFAVFFMWVGVVVHDVVIVKIVSAFGL